MTIFDHIRNLTVDKKPVNTYSDEDMKSFNPYMINIWLSMDKSLIEYIDMFQKYTVGLLNKRDAYKLYLGILPQKKLFLKYVKCKSNNNVYDEIATLINLKTDLSVSIIEMSEYIQLFFSKNDIIYTLTKIGVDNNKMKSIIKQYMNLI